MLAHRIIPTLLCRGGALVKGKGFDSWRSAGVVMQGMRVHQMRGVDEVLLMDIGATKDGREPDYKLVERLAATCFFPLTVGGGVRLEKHARQLLRSGADKIAIGSEAMINPRLIRNLADRYGSQAITVVVDVKDGKVWNHATGETLTISPKMYAKAMQEHGAGEIVLQSVTNDGTMKGYDLEQTHAVAAAVTIPVVASGGCSGYEDMHRALEAGADAVAAGALWQFGDYTPQGAAMFLHDRGWPVRLPGECLRRGGAEAEFTPTPVRPPAGA